MILGYTLYAVGFFFILGWSLKLLKDRKKKAFKKSVEAWSKSYIDGDDESKLDWHDKNRMEMPDSVLLGYYNIILSQHKRGFDREKTLAKYINELEFRGLKYEEPR